MYIYNCMHPYCRSVKGFSRRTSLAGRGEEANSIRGILGRTQSLQCFLIAIMRYPLEMVLLLVCVGLIWNPTIKIVTHNMSLALSTGKTALLTTFPTGTTALLTTLSTNIIVLSRDTFSPAIATYHQFHMMVLHVPISHSLMNQACHFWIHAYNCSHLHYQLWNTTTNHSHSVVAEQPKCGVKRSCSPQVARGKHACMCKTLNIASRAKSQKVAKKSYTWVTDEYAICENEHNWCWCIWIQERAWSPLDWGATIVLMWQSYSPEPTWMAEWFPNQCYPNGSQGDIPTFQWFAASRARENQCLWCGRRRVHSSVEQWIPALAGNFNDWDKYMTAYSGQLQVASRNKLLASSTQLTPTLHSSS